MGMRLSSSRTGAAAGAVLYPKGAYILHMLRMMWNRDDGDQAFKVMLRDFVASHRNQPVTTADFQAVVEKHMLPGMDLGGDGTMNWHFRQFVHGTALPGYRLQHTVSKQDGQTLLSVKITQSNVGDGFVMPVPIYIELQDGRVIRLGSATLRATRPSSRRSRSGRSRSGGPCSTTTTTCWRRKNGRGSEEDSGRWAQLGHAGRRRRAVYF
jgi:hypothetical protein